MNLDQLARTQFPQSFIGILGVLEFKPASYFKHNFNLHIFGRKKTSNFSYINGFIEDDLGLSSFEGAINDRFIMFNQQYLYAAIKQGANPNLIRFTGISNDSDYGGYYCFEETACRGFRKLSISPFVLRRINYFNN